MVLCTRGDIIESNVMDQYVRQIYMLQLASQIGQKTLGNLVGAIPIIYYCADLVEIQKRYIMSKKVFNKQWCVYMLHLANNAYYTGITNNIENRLKAHREGKGSKYVRSHLPLRLEYLEIVKDRSEASKIEYKIKNLGKAAKKVYITRDERCSCGLSIKFGQEMPSQILCPNCQSIIDLEE